LPALPVTVALGVPRPQPLEPDELELLLEDEELELLELLLEDDELELELLLEPPTVTEKFCVVCAPQLLV
jgi:hypothetical protein